MNTDEILNFLAEIFTTIGDIAVTFWEELKSTFDYIAGGILNFSPILVLLLLGVGTGLVVWAFNFIRGLLGKIGNR